ncbi:hypothetical protein FCL40_07090 [Ferrimonas sediminicola]|uniref:Uncharacterized protein n=1 Tax=Ferrimonas sediminicola TaxID=2569538 RepID=A0A4V5NVC3_9GAMM|nr:hypothetical protein [Ferrimonas sediminicola]TKB49909.1 hypothetical protein FCL40_07090 [Ferrimonas sediminicola]
MARELIRGQGEYTLCRQELGRRSGVSECQVRSLFPCDSDLRLSIAESEFYTSFKHLEYSVRFHRHPAKALLYHACWKVYEAKVMGRIGPEKLVPCEAALFSAGKEFSRRYLRALANYEDYLVNQLKPWASMSLGDAMGLYQWVVEGHLLVMELHGDHSSEGYRALVDGIGKLLEIEPDGRPSDEELQQWRISDFSAADPYESTLAVSG